MDVKQQTLLIEYLISSPDTFALCSPIIKDEYFDPELRSSIRYINEYYEKYNSLPDPDNISANTEKDFKRRDITEDQVLYCTEEVETFCQRKAIEIAIYNAAKMYQENKYDEIQSSIRDAILVSLNKDIGVSFFEDPKERLQQLLNQDDVEPTGWTEFDKLLGDGLVRKQLLLLSANSGGGKSVVMANLGLNFFLKGMTVLVISLELSQEMIEQRYIQMITGLNRTDWKKEIDKATTTIEQVGRQGNNKDKNGSLHIRRMKQGSNSNDIRAYLKEFQLKYKKIPDMIIVDYVDIMGANEHISADNVFEKDKRASEQLREIGEDYNAFMVSASQQNRGAVTTDNLNHSHIAGGISKINTTDVYVSIIMSDKNRAEGSIGFHFLKTRSSDGVGKTIYLKWNGISLRITNQNSIDPMNINKKEPDVKKEINTTDENDEGGNRVSKFIREHGVL